MLGTMVGPFTDTLTKGGGGGDPNRYMVAATRAQWPGGFLSTWAAGLNYQASELYFGMPDYPSTQLIIPFVSWGLQQGGSSPQETYIPNGDMVIDEAVLLYNGQEYPILFNGAGSVTLAPDTSILGAVSVNIAAWATVGVRTIAHGTVGQTYVGGYRIQRHRGERLWAAGDLTTLNALIDSNAPNNSTLDDDDRYNETGNATTSQTLAIGPAQIFSKGGWDGRPVVLMVNDSLAERQEIAASADSRGNMGILERWLDQRDSTYKSIPNIRVGVPGAASMRELTGSGATVATKRWALIDQVAALNTGGVAPWTTVLDASGRNDNSATASTWLSRKYGLVDRIRSRYGAGTRVIGMTILPTVTTATNKAYHDAADISVATLWDAVAGTLKTVNDDIIAGGGGRYQSVIDWVPAFCDASVFGKIPPATNYPLGINIVGHPGNQDGVTLWDTLVTTGKIEDGEKIHFEYQSGLYINRTVKFSTNNGNGTWTAKLNEATATACLIDNAPLWAAQTEDGIHPTRRHVLYTVDRLAQSAKAVFRA